MRISTLIIREMEDQIVPMLQNCSNMAQLKKIHAHILKSSLSQSSFLSTKIIDMCNIKGETDYASLIFEHVIEPNVFLYNAMIQAYTHNHLYKQAVRIYRQMLTNPQGGSPVLANKFTFPFVLKACTGLAYLELGKQIHGHVCKFGTSSNSFVENSLMDMYTKCDDLSDAHRVFDGMTERDVVSWNSLISAHAKLGQMKKATAIFDSMPEKSIVSWTTLISGYFRIGCYSDALEVFHQMQLAGMKPDEISIIAVLPACAQLGALELCKWIHVYADKNGLLQKTCVCNALIETYAKSGSIDQAKQLFNGMSERDVISWSTMIGGLANHGRAREAIRLFAEMKKALVKPNSITFLSILSSCAHSGFLNEGLQYFDYMTKDYGIKPSVEHYGCMVDLLGRSGCLDQAVEFIDKMPIAPDATMWGSLLSACRTHGNIEIAIIAMEHLLELEPDDVGNYVLLSNIYAAAGKWDGVSRMRKLMRSKRMKKTPGCSLIEVNNVVQEFVAGDESNPLSDEIYRMLELLAPQLSRAGPETAILGEGCQNIARFWNQHQILTS
ncbi:mitochondrial editing factor 21 [Tasmannia lanceolata]|uniref:mitochondrial editing factor 21 n=1 Tax=Tasmannia lanceolata TaxID=3420 RepID=UPI0040639005